MTSRGWWFLLIVATLLALGVLTNQTSLALLALTLICWFAWTWLNFAVSSRLADRCLTVERKVGDEKGTVDTLWAGQTYQVHVRLHLTRGLRLPHAGIADRMPFGAEHVSGPIEDDGPIRIGVPLSLTYQLRCPAAGRIRFEGIRLALADLQGFFCHATFVPGMVEYRVLPRLTAARGRTSSLKRHNLLPPPGGHRLRRSGSGSELLDLRDYLPGDPPRTIAWKVSARRDRLITKEFESEVPVRCTLFVDTSRSVRLGPTGQNALARLVDIAAAVAQANNAGRDLTGLCLFDDETSATIRPARTGRHLLQLLNVLTDAAGLAPRTGFAALETLLPLAQGFCEEVYPYMLRPEVNHMPFWLPWLCPRPACTIRRPTLADRAYRLLPVFMALYSLMVFGLLGSGLLAALHGVSFLRRAPDLFVACVSATAMALVFFLLFVPVIFFFPRRRLHYRWRKQQSALLSVRYGLAPGGLALLLEDDEIFTRCLQRFLAEHRVPYPVPLYDREGRYLFAVPEKIPILATALLGTVRGARDNELFVLLADVLELAGQLDPLLRAVRVALARHHQVVVICPWPVGLPAPGEDVVQAGVQSSIRSLVRKAVQVRFQRAFHEIRQAFTGLGVPVVNAQSEEPVHLILSRMDRLRVAGRRR